MFKRYLFLSTIIVGLSVLSSLFVSSCLGSKKTTTVEIPEEPEGVSCGQLTVGQTITEDCPSGQKGERISVCGADGKVKLALDSCEIPKEQCGDIVSFEDVKPILTDFCVSCHFTPTPYDNYELAKEKIDSFMRRINLGNNNPERMPKEPLQPLSLEQKSLLDTWQADGLKETDDCEPAGSDYGLINLFDIESAILSDLAKIEQSDRRNTRYLVMSHRNNLNVSEKDLEAGSQAIAKVLNSMNSDFEDLYLAEPIDQKKSIYRFDLRTYALNRDDWQLIEKEDPFDFESFTDEGETIKFLTGARKAWLHFDNFIGVTQKAQVYYQIMGVSKDLNTFLADVGVNARAQFADFSAMFLGFNGSEISLQKNRLIVRFEGEEGYVWITFDPSAADAVNRNSNLFLAPCLLGTGCNALFKFTAGEVIWTLPNGLQGYALFDEFGVRQDFAPIAAGIVADTRSPLDPQIDNAIDCHRCHSKGILPSVDEIRDHVLRNGDQFTANDRQIILQLYKDTSANNAAFQLDNRTFKAAMDFIKVSTNNEDPISVANDDLKLDWDLKELAAYVFISETDLKQGIEGSAVLSGQIGQLVTGGRITFNQLIDKNILDALKNDLRLFQEEL